MIGEVSQMKDENGKLVFGVLVDMDNCTGAKRFVPCNQLLWELKDKELQNQGLIPRKVEIKFIK